MNIFSRIKSAIAILGSFITTNASVNASPQMPGVHETRKGKLRFKPESRKVRVRWTDARGIKGPVFTPSAEHHHASRQTCRARLRGLFFAQFSNEYPNASRRQRRRVSRFAAQAEYRRMMSDRTNQIGDFDAAVANA